MAGSATVVVLVLLLVVSVVVLRGGRSKGRGPTALVVDWAEQERVGIKLFVDGKLCEFPESGPLVQPCRPGKRRVRALRRWFKPFDEVVEVQAGEQKQIEPDWVPEPCLVLRLSAHERDATVEIDGDFQPLSGRAVEARPEEVWLKLEPGRHHLRIMRRDSK